MISIPLTQGKSVLIDNADFDLIKDYKWCAWQATDDIWYAVTNNKSDRKQIKMHRLILGLTCSKTLADHIDGDGLNNQRYNLRTASNAQNCRNKRKRKNTSSKYIGVFSQTIKTQRGNIIKYQAQIKLNGKSTYIGLFEYERDAAIAYDIKAKEYFKEYAKLNFN